MLKTIKSRCKLCGKTIYTLVPIAKPHQLCASCHYLHGTLIKQLNGKQGKLL